MVPPCIHKAPGGAFAVSWVWGTCVAFEWCMESVSGWCVYRVLNCGPSKFLFMTSEKCPAVARRHPGKGTVAGQSAADACFFSRILCSQISRLKPKQTRVGTPRQQRPSRLLDVFASISTTNLKDGDNRQPDTLALWMQFFASLASLSIHAWIDRKKHQLKTRSRHHIY